MADSDRQAGRRAVLKSIGAAAGAGTIGLAGCIGGGAPGGAGGNSGSRTTGGGASEQRRTLVFGGGEQGGSPYQMGTGLAQVVKEETDGRIDINTQTSGGDEIEFRGVKDGTFDMATGTTPSFFRAGTGKEPFKEEIHVNICFTWSVIPFPLGWTLAKNDDIRYLEDLEGKRIGTGVPGSTTHFYFTSYCEANGIDLDSMKFQRISAQEGLRLVNDGRLDAVISGATNDSPPAPVLQWLSRTNEPKLVVPKEGERSVALGEFVGGGVVWDLDLTQDFGAAWENSAASDRETITMIAGTTTLFSHVRIPDDPIYRITKVAIENRDRLPDYHALWEGFANDPEKYAMAMRERDAEASPWHPGAAKALKEFDYWDEKFPIAERQ